MRLPLSSWGGGLGHDPSFLQVGGRHISSQVSSSHLALTTPLIQLGSLCALEAPLPCFFLEPYL